MAHDERLVCEISLGKYAGWAVEGSPATGPPDARIFVKPQLSDLRSMIDGFGALRRSESKRCRRSRHA